MAEKDYGLKIRLTVEERREWDEAAKRARFKGTGTFVKQRMGVVIDELKAIDAKKDGK